jgi:hypothetical protein
MNGVLNLQWLGRFGNNCFQYCFGRAFAEKYDLAFRTDPWEGELIFGIQHERPVPSEIGPTLDENTLDADSGDFPSAFTYRSYSQHQKCLIYTRKQAREWLKWKPEVASVLAAELFPPSELLAHRRVGDYPGYGYPVVSACSYLDCCVQYGLDKTKLRWITEESPTKNPMPSVSDWVADFWRMCHCKTLLRGNSSFSYWAGVLGNADVYAPVIEGKPGGVEQDFPFVPGNWPRFNTQGFLTDLHLAEG